MSLILPTEPITVALADDHQLLLNGLALLVNNFDNCTVLYTALNGQELIEKVQQQGPPHILLLDMNMPQMDGYQTALWLQQHHPNVKILMLTMHSTDVALIRLLLAGVKGFLKKDAAPNELKTAIYELATTGFYFRQQAIGQMVQFLNNSGPNGGKPLLSEREEQFLQLCCSDRTYKEIALEMQISPSSVDHLRNELFIKLQINSRVGLALYAVKQGLVSLH